MRDDGAVTASALDQLHATPPAGTEGAFVELSSGGHGFPTWGNCSGQANQRWTTT